MNPFLRSFGHLAIRLLLAIYWNQTLHEPIDAGLIADTQDWLEKNNERP